MKFRPPVHVAFLCSADSYRGSAVSFQHLALGMAAHHTSVRVFTGDESLTTPMRAAGVDVVQLDLASTNLRTARRLRAELAAFGAEVLVVDRPRDVRLGMLATVASKVRLVSRYNSHAPAPPRDVLTRIAYRFGVTQTIFLTQEMAQRVLQRAPWMKRATHQVIPEGISLDEFRPDEGAAESFRARHGLGDEPFVLAVGALTREKRVAMIVDTMRMLPDAPLLVICGEGPLAEKLAWHAETLDVRVRLLGRLPRETMRGAYNAAAVMAHACDVETFGLSVLEAMACGTPVVGVRSGGLPEVVGTDGAAGVLVDPSDPGEMANAIDRLLRDPGHAAQMGLAARARALSRFAVGRMNEDYARAILAGTTHSDHD